MKISASPSGHVPPTRLLAVLLSPVQRVADDVPAWGKAGALLLAGGQYLLGDAFAWALLATLLAIGFDHLYGTLAARYHGSYTPALAHAGLLGKACGLTVALLLRGAEAWAAHFAGVNTRGAFAVAIAAGLFVCDVQSIEDHRLAFGGKPIPFLSRALAWLNALATAKLPAVPPAPPPDGAP